MTRDVVGHSRDAGAEAAEAADEELDFHAGLGGGVEASDDFRVLQGVHLGDDAGLFAGAGVLDLAADLEDETLAHD